MFNIPILIGERWAPARSFENILLVSTYGRAWSIAKNKPYSLKPNKRGYVKPCTKLGRLSLHRIIFSTFVRPLEKNEQIDHINRIRHDNRLSNLRACSRSENQMNSKQRKTISGFRGVTYNNGRWSARIVIHGQTRRLGSFNCPTRAAIAYDRAAMKTYRSFANTNFGE